MPKKKDNRIVKVSENYAQLRRRVKQQYNLPTYTAADALIAVMFEQQERARAEPTLSFKVSTKPEEKELRRFLGGFS